MSILNMRKTTTTLLLCGLLMACSQTSVENTVIDEPIPASSEQFDTLHSKAILALEAASAASTEWLSTADLLKKSEVAAQQENWNAAVLLAQQALHQAEMSLQQSNSEAKAWRSRVVR